MVFILNLCNTPEIFTSLDNSAVESLDILRRANDGEWDGIGQHASVFNGDFVVGLYGRLVDTDTLSRNDIANTPLEQEEVVLGKRIGFCNDRDQVDTRAKPFHDFNVERLETTKIK